MFLRFVWRPFAQIHARALSLQNTKYRDTVRAVLRIPRPSSKYRKNALQLV